MKNPLFIVAEVSKTWVEGEQSEWSIRDGFEGIINVNWNRGYELHSFQLHQIMAAEDQMNETIIAVFKLRKEEPTP
jgi:hypothetical protein